MVEALEHGRPIVNGYSGQRPAFFTGLVDTLRDFPSPDALWTLHDLQVRYVVTSSPVTIAGDANPLVRRADFDGRTIYECVWTPAIEANLVRPEGPAPPPPRHIPFGVGEVARYRVVWRSSGALDLAAGEVVFAVTAPASPDAAGGAAFRFDLTAHTSPLVSNFFEARDRFWSLADAQVRPSLHVQEFREGRRVLDRAAVFDTAGRMVRTANGPPEAARPGHGLPPSTGARDPVSAFYYARSIGLTLGSLVQIPERFRPQSFGGTARGVRRDSQGRGPVTSGVASRDEVDLSPRTSPEPPRRDLAQHRRAAPSPGRRHRRIVWVIPGGTDLLSVCAAAMSRSHEWASSGRRNRRHRCAILGPSSHPWGIHFTFMTPIAPDCRD